MFLMPLIFIFILRQTHTHTHTKIKNGNLSGFLQYNKDDFAVFSSFSGFHEVKSKHNFFVCVCINDRQCLSVVLSKKQRVSMRAKSKEYYKNNRDRLSKQASKI